MGGGDEGQKCLRSLLVLDSVMYGRHGSPPCYEGFTVYGVRKRGIMVIVSSAQVLRCREAVCTVYTTMSSSYSSALASFSCLKLDGSTAPSSQLNVGSSQTIER